VSRFRGRPSRGVPNMSPLTQARSAKIPKIVAEDAYSGRVRTHIALGVACASIVSMLALSACTGTADDVTPSSESVVASATSSPQTVDPTIPVEPSLPAGIPTAPPSSDTASDPATLNASVLITLATVDPDTGGLLVGGYVTGVIEDGGDCQYVVRSNSGESFTIHKDGVENNGSTSCGSTTVAPSRVPAGTYTVSLRYVNDRGEAESDAVKVDIP